MQVSAKVRTLVDRRKAINDRIDVIKDAKELEKDLAKFIKGGWHVLEPTTPLLWNWHLDTICAYVMAFYRGDIRRLIINVPPGTMKSLTVSVFAAAWAWTWDPSMRILNLTNELGLATRDNLRMRNIIESAWYQERWGKKVVLSKEQAEKTHFANEAHGFRQGLGFNGNITGKRANKLIIDDPHDAEKAFSDAEIEGVLVKYDQAVSNRLSDPVNDGICLIMQRLRVNDLAGHIFTKKKGNWCKVIIPMEYEGDPLFDPGKDLGPEYAHLGDPRKEVGELLWKERFPKDVLEEQYEDLGEYGIAGQMQQRPSPLSGGILKKQWWRIWPNDRQWPLMSHVFCSWDTAFSDKDLKKNAFSAMLAFGVFYHDGLERTCIMLLRAWWKRAGYPELRKKSRELSRDPGLKLDAHLIERKASGISLIQDMRRNRRVRVRGYDPKGDGDKVGRAYVVSPLVESGVVWIPDRRWAREVVDLVADFPTGAPPSADLTDCATQAIQYIKRGHWVRHPDDDTYRAEENLSEEEIEGAPERKRAAYG